MDKPALYDQLNQRARNLAEIETQCHAVEAALRESEEKYRVMLNSTHDLALLVKRDGTVLAVNTSMAEKFGKSPEDFKGLNIYSLMPSEAAALRKSRAQEMLRTKLPLNYTEERMGHFFDCNLFPIIDDDGTVKRFTVFVQDVTEGNRLNLEFIRQNHRISQGQHQEEIGYKKQKDKPQNLSLVPGVKAFLSRHGRV
jgi:PAS domain S-box-containing protein